MVRVGAYCIRPTNAHVDKQMIDLPDTFWGVCNTSLPIRNKYLINTHLLNLIPDKNWIVRVGACCIRPTNVHDHGQMIDPPDTFWGVCNTPLPIRDKYLINMYLLNPTPGKDWIIRLGAYYIRTTNSHDHERMIDPPDKCWDVCNMPLHVPDKYLTNMYLLNLLPDKDWIVHVGSFFKSPTNYPEHGPRNVPPATFWGVCNTPLPIRDKFLINTYLLNLITVKD